MKRSNVIMMSQYREGGLAKGEDQGGSQPKPLPDASQLWELLERNISIEIWKKGI